MVYWGEAKERQRREKRAAVRCGAAGVQAYNGFNSTTWEKPYPLPSISNPKQPNAFKPEQFASSLVSTHQVCPGDPKARTIGESYLAPRCFHRPYRRSAVNSEQ